MYQFILPDAGEGTHEAEVLTWYVKVGDKVQEDQIILEIQSDKAAVELPCPVAGTIMALHAQEGEMALVGKPIADIALEGEASAPASAGDSQAAPATPTPSSAVPDSGTTVTPASPAGPMSPDAMADLRTMAVPRVRKYARTKGVDLHQVTGTGNHGKITLDDVDAFLAGGGAPAAATAVTDGLTPVAETAGMAASAPVSSTTLEATPSAVTPVKEITQPIAEDTVTKLSAMRRTIAKAMVQSLQVSPHVTVFDQVEVSALVEHRDRMKGMAKAKDIKLTYSAYFVKALVAMLKRFPELNCSMNLEKGELYTHNYYNIGVATNTPHGLYVPMIRNAERLSLFEIAQKITHLSDNANAGELKPTDMGKGSITLTNVGGAATGGVWSTPIINQPEVAILGVGRIEEQFVPDEDRNPVLKPMLKLSFVFDHRVVDGVTAQEAINLLKTYLNNPDLLLSEG